MPAVPDLHHAEPRILDRPEGADPSFRVVYVPPLKTRRTENRKTVQSGLTQQQAHELAATLDRGIHGFGSYGAAFHEVMSAKAARPCRPRRAVNFELDYCEGG